MRMSRAGRTFYSILYFFSIVHAFSFVDEPATQCGDLKVTWAGGTPPFILYLIPKRGDPSSVTIPSDAFNAGEGNFSMPMPYKENQQYIVTMSDATGFGAGGFSTVKAVGASLGETCNSTGPISTTANDFEFQLNSTIQQCRPLTFTDYGAATKPITIIGVIPGAQAVILPPSNATQSEYTWPQVTVAGGNQIVFMMVDAQGRQGRTTGIMTVGITDDASCLSAPVSVSPSPSWTMPASPPATVIVTPPAPSWKWPRGRNPNSGGLSTAAIVGTVFGALSFVGICGILVLMVYRRRQNNRGPPADLGDDTSMSASYVGEVADQHPPPFPFIRTEPTIFSSTMSTRSQPMSPVESRPGTSPRNMQPGAGLLLTAAQRKAATRQANSARYVIHNDAEDQPQATTSRGLGVVELPPQYSDRRSSVSTAINQPSIRAMSPPALSVISSTTYHSSATHPQAP